MGWVFFFFLFSCLFLTFFFRLLFHPTQHSICQRPPWKFSGIVWLVYVSSFADSESRFLLVTWKFLLDGAAFFQSRNIPLLDLSKQLTQNFVGVPSLWQGIAGLPRDYAAVIPKKTPRCVVSKSLSVLQQSLCRPWLLFSKSCRSRGSEESHVY